MVERLNATDRGRRRGQPLSQYLPVRDLRVPERRALFGVPVDRAEHRVDVHQRQGVDAVQHTGAHGQGQQVLAQYRVQLPDVPTG
jgi:hypothetical protein